MEKFDLDKMTRGWFVGDFEPTIIKTKHCEVGVKFYTAGTIESAHYHSKAEEVTVVVAGKVRMNDVILGAGDIVKVLTDEVVEFEALEDSTTVIYKTASVAGDKFLIK